MGLKRTEEFRQDAVRIALTSGLARKQVADDLGVGMSTLKNGSWHIGTLTWCRKRIWTSPKRMSDFGVRSVFSRRSIRLGQAAFSAHFLLSRNRAFARTSSLRMTAVMATFFSFPAVTS